MSPASRATSPPSPAGGVWSDVAPDPERLLRDSGVATVAEAARRAASEGEGEAEADTPECGKHDVASEADEHADDTGLFARGFDGFRGETSTGIGTCPNSTRCAPPPPPSPAPPPLPPPIGAKATGSPAGDFSSTPPSSGTDEVRDSGVQGRSFFFEGVAPLPSPAWTPRGMDSGSPDMGSKCR